MLSLQNILASSMNYSLTWCEYGRQEPYNCGWRIDPCLVIIYVPSGPYRLLVNTGETVKSFDAKPGDAFLIPAGHLHRFESPTCDIGGVNIHYTLFGSVDILAPYRVPYHVPSSLGNDLGSCIESIVNTIGVRPRPKTLERDDNLDLATVARERQLVFELLAKVLNMSEMLPKGKERLLALHRLKRALEYLEENLVEKITVDTLGEISGLSGHRFSALFRDVMGDSPHQYLLKRRIDKSMALLSNSDAPVTEIAAKLGFYDQPHFTRLFKATTGVSPTYYRKDLQRRFTTKQHST